MDKKVHYHDHYLNFSSEAFRCQEKIFCHRNTIPYLFPYRSCLTSSFHASRQGDQLLIAGITLAQNTLGTMVCISRVTARCNVHAVVPYIYYHFFVGTRYVVQSVRVTKVNDIKFNNVIERYQSHHGVAMGVVRLFSIMTTFPHFR
jgi:hypothetical protein